MELYDRIVNKNLLIRRVNLVANHVAEEASVKKKSFEQLDLFTDNEVNMNREKERRRISYRYRQRKEN